MKIAKKGYHLLLSTVLGAIFFTGCQSTSSTIAEAEATLDATPIVLSLATTHSEDFPTSIALQYFADMVKEKSQGEIIVETYFGGELGNENKTIALAQFGDIDFVRTAVGVGTLVDFEKKLNALQFPYLYRNAEHMWQVLDGEIGQELLQLDHAGLQGLAWYDGGARCFYSLQKILNGPDDFKDIALRMQENDLMMTLGKTLGATTVAMVGEDVADAFEKGKITAADNSLPTYVFQHKHSEFAKYFVLDEHVRSPELLIMSEHTKEKLTPTQLQIIEEAATASSLKQRTLWQEYEKEAHAEAVRQGVMITTPTSMEAFEKAVQPIYENCDPEYSELIARIKAVH